MLGQIGQRLSVPLVGLALLLLLPFEAFSTTQQHAEHLRAERVANGQPLALYSPVYRVGPERTASLFLVNNSSETIAPTIRAGSREGRWLDLGTYPIEPLHHFEIDLGLLLQGQSSDRHTGSLEVLYFGDADTLQGWLVHREESSLYEIPLASVPTRQTRDLTALWQLPDVVVPSFHLLNISDRPLSVVFDGPSSRRPDRASEITVPARGWRTLDRSEIRPDSHGQLVFLDTPREILVVGLHPDGTVPIKTEAELLATWYDSLLFEKRAEPAKLDLVIWNTTAQQRRATVEILDRDGTVLGTSQVQLPAFSYRTVPPTAPLSSKAVAERRLRVRGDGAGLVPIGTLTWADRSKTPLEFFDRDTAHTNGTYPIPNPRHFATQTQILNTGSDFSKIVAQITWRGGTTALGPYEISPDGVLTIDLGEIASRESSDVLGRSLDPGHSEAVLKWTVTGGSTDLLGRTMVWARESGQEATPDHFGFNCFGCCWQQPRGEVVPSLVTLAAGQSTTFQACVSYETCSGTLGPYPTAVRQSTLPSEFSWNGSQLTVLSAADANVLFEGQEYELTAGCMSNLKGFFGFGRAEACKATFNPFCYDGNRTCLSQTNGICIACIACCNNLFQEQQCEGKRFDVIQSELRLCRQNCRISLGETCP